MEVSPRVLEKWGFLVEAAKRYWIDSEPTGMDDYTFDRYEIQAVREDEFFVRDYVLDKYLKGTKTQNRYIEKIKKYKVEGGTTMLSAITKSADELGIKYEDLYCNLKYDGCSIAIYLDPSNGKPVRIVTVGNTNLDNLGVDQTWKLNKLIPQEFPKGILAIQCEALIDLSRIGDMDPNRARQKANGLINSKYCETEVASLLTLRAYRYYLSDNYTGDRNYRKIINSLPTRNDIIDGHITFAPAQVWTLSELLEKVDTNFTETDRTFTDTGLFLNDGWVLYNSDGVCQRALKYAGAGSGTESLKTHVLSIQWNDQSSKGKDSWSANVVVDPIVVRGSTIRKPSAGSVAKLLKNNITPGAEVGIVLANSTIPMVGDVFSSGNGDYSWPTCSCGYTMGPNDIYGSLLKCGNPNCKVRFARMVDYIKKYGFSEKKDLNGFLVIDRFNWENTNIDLKELIGKDNPDNFRDYLGSFLNTNLQKRNLELVWRPAFEVIRLWKEST